MASWLRRFAAVSSVLAYSILLPVAARAQAPTFLTAWGSLGTGSGQFTQPDAIAVDGSGNVYVGDTYRVQKFTSSGAFVTQWGSRGSGNGQFLAVTDLAVDASGNVYVVDVNNNRVQKFTNAGVFITKWGTLGSANGQLLQPYSMTVDAAGRVVVGDAGNGRFQRFTSTGAYLDQWSFAGTPSGVTADASGNLYVADGFLNQITKFITGGGGSPVTWPFLEWGTPGSADGQFNGPSGVATDASGYLYVADMYNNRIQKFTSTGVLLAQWGGLGSGNGQFNRPANLAVDTGGNVYVSDTNNNRVQVFGPAPTPTVSTTWGRLKSLYR